MYIEKRLIWQIIIILFITVSSVEGSEVIVRNGLKLKVVTKKQYTIVRKQPSHKSEIVRTIGQFHFLYIFSDKPSKKRSSIKTNGFYKVGTTSSKKDVLGWVHEDQVLEWNHRECLRFTSMKGREPARIYGSERALVEVIRSGNRKIYSPTSQELRDTGNINFRRLLPIINSINITINRTMHRIHKIAYLHYPVEELVEAHRHLDIVFVMDTSLSMQNYIDELKKVITTLVVDIAKEGSNDVRFGFIGYRDRMKDKNDNERMRYIDGNKKYNDDAVYRYSRLTKRHKQFLQKLDEVKEAPISSGDLAEAMLDGLHAAAAEFKETGWRKRSSKAIILIGDSSGHDKDDPIKNRHGRSIDQVLNYTAKNKIRIIALKIEREIRDIEERRDNEKHNKQMQSIAKGISPSIKGSYATIKYNQGMREEFGKQVSKHIKKELKRARELGMLEAKVAAQKKIVKPEGMEEENWTILLNNLSTSPLSKGKVTFSTGWISEIQAGKKVVEPHILITHDDLKLMAFVLDGIKVLIKSPSDKMLKTIRITFKRQTGEELDERETFADYMRNKIRLPIKTRLLQFVPSKIRQFSESKLRDITLAIEKKRQQLNQFLENQENWFAVTDEYFIGFVPTSLLP